MKKTIVLFFTLIISHCFHKNIMAQENNIRWTDFPVEIKKISPEVYEKVQRKFSTTYNPEKITDFKKVQEILKGIVEFTEDETPSVNKIHFRNGGIYKNNGDENYFIAYYPEEDILLCEGEHTADVCYGLKNSSKHQVGNPDLFVYSPQKTFRLSACHSGQECDIYAIEKKTRKGFQKHIALSSLFNALNDVDKEFYENLCTVDAVWSDEQNLFLNSHHYNEKGEKESNKFYQITFKNIPVLSKEAWKDFPVKTSFPINDSTNIRNFSELNVLENSIVESLNLRGLYPYSKDFRINYRIPFSEKFTSVVITFMNGEHELYNMLFTINNQDEIIDWLQIGYEEVAESISRTESKISKDKIILRNRYNDSENTETFKITPEGYFILE